MTQEKLNNTLATLKQHILTKRNGKIFLSLCVVCAIAAGGGHYYLHQQHQQHQAERLAAISQMIQAQAAEQNVSLISEDQARAAAAKAVGKDEGSLTFKRVALVEPGQMRHGDKDKHDKHDRGPGDRDDRHDNRPQGGPGHDARPDGAGAPPLPQPNGQNAPAAPNAPSPAAQTQADAKTSASTPQQPGKAQRPFQPLYAIRATDGQVKYDVLVDAITGKILDSRVA